MAIKAIFADDRNIQHLVIGLNRNDIDSLLRGEVFLAPSGIVPHMTENESDIVLLFAETDADLEKRFPPHLRPV